MSSHNILQLMTHLNDFEITINNVICEFATRLSSLIDANFFLILENRDGRKLCGSTGLIDEYVKGSLRPFDTDQIATFDPKIAANHFVHLDTATSASDLKDDVGGGGSSGISSRNFDINTNDVIPDNKDVVPVNSLDLSCEIDELEEQKLTSRKAGRRRRKRKSAAAVENCFDGDGGGGRGDEGAWTGKKSRMTYDEFGNFEDDICIVDDDDGDPDAVFSENNRVVDSAADEDQSAPAPCVIDETGSLIPAVSSPTRARGRSIENVLALDPNLLSEEFQVDIESLNLPFNKIQVLQSLEDPAPIFQKDSVEFKLASSILYDFGKELANVCPYSGLSTVADNEDGVKSKVFFHQNFKTFIGIFPCLKSELIQDIRIAKKSAEAHMKNNARAGFNSVFDKKKKDSTANVLYLDWGSTN